MENVFQPGDIIKGLPPSNQRYGLTNENMTLGVVTNIGSLEGKMRITVIRNDKFKDCQGENFTVLNDDTLFARVGRLDKMPSDPSKLCSPKWVKAHIVFDVLGAIPILF